MKLKGLIISLIFLLTVGCSYPNLIQGEVEYIEYDILVEDKLYLGNEQATNEILLAFDYACVWCKKWMTEILPQINDSLITTGEVKYYSQPLAVLNEKSLYMANIDFMIKQKSPSDYFAIQSLFASESGNEGWGTEEYVSLALQKYDINLLELIIGIELPDFFLINDTFMNQYGVNGVPTVYVNNIKVQDTFNIDEITSLLK